MRSGELFAGVGGLGMAVDEVFGSSPEWFCEFDTAPSKVLAYRHPDIPNYGDVTAVDWTTTPRVNILAGGFPCQDVSLAGRRKGMKDGTRSGLWSEYVKAIETLRPDWVVIENVRGLISARADSEVEPCPWCVGDGDDEYHLRALDAVLADLTALGFDATWTHIRASDVGAPHGRYRFFILAWPSENTGRSGSGGRAEGQEPPRRDDATLGSDQGGNRRRAYQRLNCAVCGEPVNPTRADVFNGTWCDCSPKLLSTPDTVPEAPNTGSNSHKAGNIVGLGNQVMSLLPTPVAQPSGNTPEDHLRKKPGREVVTDLAIIAENGLIESGGRLLPTPEAKLASSGPDYARMGREGSGGDDLTTAIWKEGLHHAASEARPSEVLQSVRRSADADEIRQRSPRGSERVPAEESLLEEVRIHEASGAAGYASVEGESGGAENDVRAVLSRGRSAHSPSGSGRDEQPSGEPSSPVQVVSPQTALAGRPGIPGEAEGGIDWGPYRSAIKRWERVLGRPAPAPVLHDGKGGKARLNAALCEWMMGWPAGHVTDPAIGLSRAEQLKACGNGVVPQQASAALRELLARPGVPPIREEAA